MKSYNIIKNIKCLIMLGMVFLIANVVEAKEILQDAKLVKPQQVKIKEKEPKQEVQEGMFVSAIKKINNVLVDFSSGQISLKEMLGFKKKEEKETKDKKEIKKITETNVEIKEVEGEPLYTFELKRYYNGFKIRKIQRMES